MKAACNNPKGFYSGSLYLIMCFILMALSSCDIVQESLKLSLDSNHQSYNLSSRGPRTSSPNDGQIGFNIGMLSLISVFTGEDFSVMIDEADNQFAGIQLFNDYLFSSEEEKIYRRLDAGSFKQHLYLMTGGEFVIKRSKNGDDHINLNYLEVPFYGIYKSQLGSGDVFGGMGLYFAYGIGGKTKIQLSGPPETISSFDEERGFKRFDAGLGWSAGYQLANSVSIFLEYDLGLLNINRDPDDFPARNRTISINVMYPLVKMNEFF